VTDQQRRRTSELFDELFGLAPADRAASLAGIDDPEVRAELESLLAHATASAESATEAVGELARAASAAGAFDGRTVGAGVRLGPYRVERRLGQGGMGDVYEAVREDDFRKLVAIKIVRHGFDSDFALQRFQQERQVLAGLEHPYIARLLDGGATAEGVPYLVLEHVAGASIDRYCAGRPVAERLELFVKVCQAVDHAHRNMVIHRDLKPSNILVTADGVPKLLDFGIAKLADSDATRTVQRAMTPQYASPEQLRNQPITVASDVYSLGAVLYELLAGRRPYAIGEATSAAEVERMVCELDPPRPNISEDLDNIVLITLRKDPARRYRSALDLSDDIERSLSHRPRARPDTYSYRAGKFVRRNRLAVAAAATVLVAVAGGVGAALYQANLAKQRFEQVRKLARTFVFDIHDEIARLQGSIPARQLVVRTAVEYLDQLSRSAGGDADLREELANAYVRIGGAQGNPSEPNLGKPKDALANYAKADRLYASLGRGDAAKTANLARFRLAYGKLKQLTGDTAGAEDQFEQAARLIDTLGVGDGQPEAQALMALLFLYRSDFQMEVRGNHAAASVEVEKAAALAGPVLARGRTREALLLIQGVEAMRSVISANGDARVGLEAIAREQALLRELLAMDPDHPVFRRNWR
jgi:tetratricopeptide (TPR) repeat protein